MTYSVEEPQVHKEEQEYILVFNRWGVTSSEADLPILPKIALAVVEGTFRLIYRTLECP